MSEECPHPSAARNSILPKGPRHGRALMIAVPGLLLTLVFTLFNGAVRAQQQPVLSFKTALV